MEVDDHGLDSTGIGAILLFFGSLPSPSSLSLASLFVPVRLFVALRGVSGGVVMGTPVTLPELATVRLGTLPDMRGGLLMTDGTAEDWVATEDVEFDLAGEDGRCEARLVDGGGDGAAKELVEPRCWLEGPDVNGDGGAK